MGELVVVVLVFFFCVCVCVFFEFLIFFFFTDPTTNFIAAVRTIRIAITDLTAGQTMPTTTI